MKERVATFLGFAQKAGKLASGDSAARALLRQGKVHLVVLATDASNRTKRDFVMLADDVEVPVLEVSSKLELGSCIGQSPRSVLVIKDPGFAKSIIESYHG